jgi:mRNA interferase MazF
MRKFDVVLLKKDIKTSIFGQHLQDLVGRPCIVISNNRNNNYCDNINIIPLTTKSKELPVHALVTDSTKQVSYALCEQLFTIDKKFVHKVVSHLDEKSQKSVIEALTIQLIA